MADCQSGAFHHYSRHQDAFDFDNYPRVFSLPMMLTGDYASQQYPRNLVYTAATDFVDWRWRDLSPFVDLALFEQAVDRFEAMIVGGDHRCLVLLPPQDGAIELFHLHKGCMPERSRTIHPLLNALWRAAAGRHPDHFTVVDLGGMLAFEDMVHAHHYVPSALQRITGLIDDWYEAQEALEAQPVAEAA